MQFIYKKDNIKKLQLKYGYNFQISAKYDYVIASYISSKKAINYSYWKITKKRNYSAIYFLISFVLMAYRTIAFWGGI